MNIIRVFLLLMTLLVLPAFGTSVTVPNFSFELPDVTDGSTGFPISNWTFSSSGTAVAGVFDPTNASYAGTTGDNAPLPGTAQGGQLAFIAFNGASSGGFLNSGVLATVAANSTYTLTVAIGDPLNIGINGATGISLLVNGNVVASAQLLPTDYPPTATGTFADLTASFTTAVSGDPLTGGNLSVQLSSGASPGATNSSADFDNVRVNVVAAPEPSGTMLLMLGATLLGSRGKRLSDPLH